MSINISSLIKKLTVLFLVIATLILGKAFLMPIVIGGILATLFLPFSNWLERNKISRALAATFSLLALLIAFGILISLLTWKISSLLDDFDMLKQKAIESLSEAQTFIFDHWSISFKKQSEIFQNEQPSLTDLMQMTVGSLKSLFTNLVLVLAYFFFLLYSRSHIKLFFLKLTKDNQKIELEKILKRTTEVSQQYLLGLSKMIFLLWIMYSIGFSILGVQNPIFFAILCGLLEIIPFIGNITGTTLTVLVSAIHGGSFTMLLGIVITYGIVQFIQGWILEPLILGAQVKINPLFTIIALVVGDLIWGISGILLAIPITAMIKIVCDHVEPLKPYGFLIGDLSSKKKREGRFNRVFNKLFKRTKTP
ncbi:AI-2E family transporter [Lacihabitans sp. LS3-19]|uniref:AI-2E family transporter n=1 Tax=Lacihabitans sp. LS3-19 TaxID=2487335 RepID=UPI0020CE5ACB|nr:AI-2E family transporter [Lacihabitans sp. LS3-19]MCP9768675.1 AI-2E family transporter [Lacihabitans sp. LS3-19]